MQVTPSFGFVGGHLCLDFVNTASARTDVPTNDKLKSPEDLAQWCKAADLKIAAPFAPQVFTRALVLRETLYRVFTIEAPPPADLATLQKEISIARKHQRLIYGKGSFAWTFDHPKVTDRLLWTISLASAELLLCEDRAKIRQCADEECGWLFLDTSRNHSRQWCIMRDCGNRAKLRRFRERQRLQPAIEPRP